MKKGPCEIRLKQNKCKHSLYEQIMYVGGCGKDVAALFHAYHVRPTCPHHGFSHPSLQLPVSPSSRLRTILSRYSILILVFAVPVLELAFGCSFLQKFQKTLPQIHANGKARLIKQWKEYVLFCPILPKAFLMFTSVLQIVVFRNWSLVGVCCLVKGCVIQLVQGSCKKATVGVDLNMLWQRWTTVKMLKSDRFAAMVTLLKFNTFHNSLTIISSSQSKLAICSLKEPHVSQVLGSPIAISGYLHFPDLYSMDYLNGLVLGCHKKNIGDFMFTEPFPSF